MEDEESELVNEHVVSSKMKISKLLEENEYRSKRAFYISALLFFFILILAAYYLLKKWWYDIYTKEIESFNHMIGSRGVVEQLPIAFNPTISMLWQQRIEQIMFGEKCTFYWIWAKDRNTYIYICFCFWSTFLK